MKKLTILIVAAALATPAFAQSGKKQQMSQEEMMEKMTAYATPGAMHQMLASANGSWTTETTMWMDPAAPAQKAEGTCDNSMILGGRYQQSLFKGDFGGMPFEGIGTMAYDNTRKVFISTWIDNMGTGIMTMEGSYNATTKTMSLKGKMVDCTTGKNCNVRETFKMVDDNNQVMEMYMTPAGGKEYKCMVIKFARK